MNTRSQLIVDKYIAKPVAYVMNFFVRLAGQILSIDHNLDKEFKTIAVCKFKGMGSIIQATPMLEALRKKYPNAEIIFVSTGSNQKFLEKIKWIDTIVVLNDKGFFKLISSTISSLLFLIRKRPEVYIDLEIYSDFSTLFTLFTLSKNRIGFYLRSSSFRMGIYTHMMFFNPRLPISKAYLQMASLLGCPVDETKLYPLKAANDFKVPSKPYILINPNASDLRLERRWGQENFVQLIRQLLIDYPEYDIYLIGGKEEREYTEAIANKADHSRVISTAGKTSLDDLIGYVKHARVMISNDTGPMHVAFCTNTPVVCLFGPCSPEQYGISDNAYILYKQVYCSPCVHDFEVPPCKGNNVCMKLIKPEEVLEKVKEAMNNQPVSKIETDDMVFYKDKEDTLGKVNRPL